MNQFRDNPGEASVEYRLQALYSLAGLEKLMLYIFASSDDDNMVRRNDTNP